MAEQKNITATQVIELVRQQNFRCAISGRKLTPETASLDHIIPLGRGGEHSIGNVWVVDHQVNIAKGTMMLEEFVSMCKDVVEHQDKPESERQTVEDRSQSGTTEKMVPSPGSLF